MRRRRGGTCRRIYHGKSRLELARGREWRSTSADAASRLAAQLDALQRAVRKVDSVVHVARGNMAEMQRTRGKTAFWSLCRRSEFSRRGGGGA